MTYATKAKVAKVEYTLRYSLACPTVEQFMATNDCMRGIRVHKTCLKL